MGELPNAPVLDPHVPQTEGLQIGDRRLSISCVVVDCGGDDLFEEVIAHLAKVSFSAGVFQLVLF